MNARGQVDINKVVMVMTAAALTAVAFFGALTLVARPSGFTGRLANLETRTQKAEAVFRASDNSNAFPAGSVCEQGADAELSALKARVQSAAQGAGVTLASLGATATPPGQDGMTLTAVSLQFQASGRYDQVMALMAELANSQPSVFVDTADLTSKTSSVDLKFQGRVFCSASAHL